MDLFRQTIPRYIRLRDAPSYLGMDKNRFGTLVRPFLIEIPIGSHGIAFDVIDLNTWADNYKRCNGRPGIRHKELLWDAKKAHCPNTLGQVSSGALNGTVGTSIKSGKAEDLTSALKRITAMKPKKSSIPN
ncbi:hypothetical protein BST96_12195 [Oceanicoccus sagamiensis]|uniref:Uncharacterized protein n=1 Tax=Oceanicoccus sagamiensis TaxID=716816 RepID=A0A1X9N9S2_9GAMM|nr:hypothetical protein BST96_12195 [Oceanicoccus sagamiensis]